MRQVVFQEFRGLNTVSPPEALRYDARSGSCELAVAVNVDVTDGGRRLTTRPGFALALSLSEPHSPFVDGARTYLASQNMLLAVAGMMATPIFTGLTPGARLAWCRQGQAIYWSNGIQKGRIVDGQARAWGGIPFSSDAREAAEYAEPPAGTVLAAFAGRIWIGVNDEILYTVPGYPHHIRIGSCRLPRLSSSVRMIQPIDDGVYISTEHRIVFQAGVDPGAMQMTVVSHEPVIPRMFMPVLASDVVRKVNPEHGVIWATAKGLELGLSGGMIIKLTEDNVAINATASGGAMLRLPHRVVAIYHP
jgi:hypothetical protein